MDGFRRVSGSPRYFLRSPPPPLRRHSAPCRWRVRLRVGISIGVLASRFFNARRAGNGPSQPAAIGRRIDREHPRHRARRSGVDMADDPVYNGCAPSRRRLPAPGSADVVGCSALATHPAPGPRCAWTGCPMAYRSSGSSMLSGRCNRPCRSPLPLSDYRQLAEEPLISLFRGTGVGCRRRQASSPGYQPRSSRCAAVAKRGTSAGRRRRPHLLPRQRQTARENRHCLRISRRHGAARCRSALLLSRGPRSVICRRSRTRPSFATALACASRRGLTRMRPTAIARCYLLKEFGLSGAESPAAFLRRRGALGCSLASAGTGARHPVARRTDQPPR